jgi:transmembrane sensor
MQPELLEKYLNGVCTDAEKRMVEDWYFDLDKDDDIAREQFSGFDKIKAFQALKQRSEFVEAPVMATPAKVFRLSRKLMVAASIAAFAILTVGLTLVVRQPNKTSTVIVPDGSEHLVYNNTTPAVLEKKLPDGSAVWLKPGSRLVYHRSHEESNREVQFTGEAFFEVAKDPKHPFVISAQKMEIRVLGTSFNVTALPESRAFKVSVVTGKVQVTAQGKSRDSVFLLPNQQASYNVASQKIVQSVISEAQLKKQYWKPFSLKFNEEAQMALVARQLEKAFQVRVIFTNPDIENCYLKVDFDNWQLPEIMTYLEKLLDVECELVDGDTLTISGEGCSEPIIN